VFAYPGIHRSRIRELNRLPEAPGRFVLYWMQQSQRAESNHALEYAVREAARLGQGVLVAFGLTADYPDANLRHYAFMLEGLAETGRALGRRGIPLVVRLSPPPAAALAVGDEASVIVCDVGYLRHQRAWREQGRGAASSRSKATSSSRSKPPRTVRRSVRARCGPSCTACCRTTWCRCPRRACAGACRTPRLRTSRWTTFQPCSRHCR
jgi:deoxyribodipyrimidine photo-lyase